MYQNTWLQPGLDKLETLDFADDLALISTTQHQMQKKTDKLAETSQRIWLNVSKTKITEPVKFQNGKAIKETKDFTYLGTVVSTERGFDKDMDSRLSKAKTAFRKLKRIRGSKQYNRRTKIRLFNTLVKPVLLYMEVRHGRQNCPRQQKTIQNVFLPIPVP